MHEWKSYITSFIWGPLLVAQIVLVLAGGIINEAGLDYIMYVGWGIWALSILFGWLPILTFKKKGGVSKGKSYVHTTKIVDSGIYSVVRHPQYVAGILWSLALVLISQSWLIVAMGIIVTSLLYVDILMADHHELEKFGNAYRRYMQMVPRANFLLGLIRLVRSNKNKQH